MSEDSNSEGSSADELSWIEWFCRLPGHEYFCEVDRSYIEDNFNMYGLRHIVPNYQVALDTILDYGDGTDYATTAKELYGLIHARFIITTRGLEAMAKKFRTVQFGVCPRELCSNQSVVPAGIYDEAKKATVKVFCPSCRDIYASSVETMDGTAPDGAFFGTTFPHLFFLQYPNFEPSMPATPSLYIPRVFGYRIKGKGPNENRLAINVEKQDKAGDDIPTPNGTKMFSTLKLVDKSKVNAEEEAKSRSRKRRAV